MDDIFAEIRGLPDHIGCIIDSMRREIKTYFLQGRRACTIDKLSLGTRLRGIGIEGATSGQQKAS
jgi:hypothetical protein